MQIVSLFDYVETLAESADCNRVEFNVYRLIGKDCFIDLVIASGLAAAAFRLRHVPRRRTLIRQFHCRRMDRISAAI